MITLAPSVPVSLSLACATAASRNSCPVPPSSTTPRIGAKYSTDSTGSGPSPWPTSTIARVRSADQTASG